jgi:hypothetical protein
MERGNQGKVGLGCWSRYIIFKKSSSRVEGVITQVVGWENPDPNHNMETTKRTPTHLSPQIGIPITLEVK